MLLMVACCVVKRCERRIDDSNAVLAFSNDYREFLTFPDNCLTCR